MAAKVMVKSDTHDGIRQRVSAALTKKHNPTGMSDYYGDPYVQDMFPDKAIHTMPGKEHRGKLFASKFDASKEDMGLGEPKEVQQAYKPMAEASQGLVSESAAFIEAKAYNGKTKELVVTIIKPGFNTSKGRYYTQKAITETGGIFAGAKMFANHQTKAEAAARPEGSIHDWVANLGTPYVETDGSLKAKAKVFDEALGKKFEALQEAGLLQEMGVSIRAAGLQTPGTVDGQKTMIVESFVSAKSVDFVTFPGAGGKVDMMESDGQHFLSATELDEVFQESDANDIDLLPLAVLRTRRPDLVAQITQEAQESFNMAKTNEELERELKESQEKSTRLEKELKESQDVGKKAAVQVLLTAKLTEAKLPEPAEKRIRAQFAEATEVTGIVEAISAEGEYIKSLGVSGKPGVRGLGAVQESGAAGETSKVRSEYIAAQMKGGMTKEMAESSADDMGV